MTSPYSFRHKFCFWCKHCINEQLYPGQFLCGKDGKRYSAKEVNEYGEPAIPCVNGQWEVNEDKLVGIRW